MVDLTNTRLRYRLVNTTNQAVIMAKVVNLYTAKTNLSELVDRAAEGEEIVIAKAGVPMARLVPLHTRDRNRRPGGWEGRTFVATDFDAPLPEDVLKAFSDGSAEQ